MDTNNLSQEIQAFYDASSGLWEQIWGEHMHHGYYGRIGNYKIDRRQAQIDLIEEVLTWGGAKSPKQVLDVGCGIGGATLYLAQKYQAQAVGITLSPVQTNRAKERSRLLGLESQTDFLVADALAMPFADDSFDLVWSLESGEHMPDKEKFLKECYRVLKPGGLFLMATWCHRSTQDSVAGLLTEDEQQHLQKIYDVYRLPYVISISGYETIAHQVGFQAVRLEDWSLAVAPFWNFVIDSVFDLEAIIGLLQSGWTTIQAAMSLGLMSRGYERGLIRFGLLSGTKQ
jgi:tocopherol O-methyltransferase